MRAPNSLEENDAQELLRVVRPRRVRPCGRFDGAARSGTSRGGHRSLAPPPMPEILKQYNPCPQSG